MNLNRIAIATIAASVAVCSPVLAQTFGIGNDVMFRGGNESSVSRTKLNETTITNNDFKSVTVQESRKIDAIGPNANVWLRVGADGKVIGGGNASTRTNTDPVVLTVGSKTVSSFNENVNKVSNLEAEGVNRSNGFYEGFNVKGYNFYE